ncbi:proprotein convertase P-domain-containing protein [Arenibacter sp. BSSL-BM3]|uniref:Proprotein convertase P-domain-containing protein n=1 Tax=Arenibacter arenosicollis TaxID=2762274 RepID=A0ABR7QPF7_9FLAO|nr:zinc-dependent metalloprotease family protein [Arenibacter arenosicollis]MBC8769087.1 proprotein convertase P-domain-containing protein [Arenibacter arenosicollis]
MVVKLRLVFSISIFFLCYCGFGQTKYWQKTDSRSNRSQRQTKELEVKHGATFSLQKDVFVNELKSTHYNKASKILSFPDEDGEMIPFVVQESSVLSPELSKKYPQIKSYVGRGLNNAKDRVRFSVSQNGIQSMIVYGDSKSATFMQKISNSDEEYLVYSRKDAYMMNTNFICETQSLIEKEKGPSALKLVDGQVLRKYRLAISATGEYTEFHGGTIPNALAAINATVTRVNEIFETDLGISLEIVANTDQVIYTDKETDPYGSNLNSEVQNTLTTVIGPVNYDVGHLFQKDENGGNAGFIASVCIDSRKGSAYSSALIPQGDIFDLDFVAHEMGHQFGANHTWSFESEGTLVQAEPGSGTTIMGYAGISGSNNVALNGDDYFHYYSIFQILEYIKTTSCGQEIPILNSPPTIVSSGNFTIPKSTAFKLTGNATDLDMDDILTYNWEQINDGIVTHYTFGPTNLSGANFRSLKPTVKPSRYFPRLSSIVSGNLTQTNPNVNTTWETVSNVERELDFALTVRDNALGGGQVASDLVKVTVIDNAGPFVVTSQSTNEIYTAGTRQEVLWDVANTDQGPVNAQKVDIYFSANGGASFPIKLADSVPNDGQQDILIPGFATPSGRIMVSAHDNIFLALNSSNFTISPSDIVLNFAQLQHEVCQGNDLIAPFTYQTFNGFSEEATFSATGMPPGLTIDFSPTSAIVNDTLVDITFSNTDLVTPGNYPITIVATSATASKEVVIDVKILETTFTDIVLQLPTNGSTSARIASLLEWESNTSHTSFDVEIADDPAFTNIIETASVIFNSYLTTNLVEETTYYWRVKPKNSCGEGTFGPAFSFTTLELNCALEAAKDLPLTIPTTGAPTVTSVITLLNDLPIADVNVNLDITHTFLADLEISLISPAGTRVILVSNSCGGNQDILATFDDTGNSFVCGTSPAIQGIVRPLGSLGAFNGESTYGDWILEVKDIAASDGGSINGFSLDICVEGTFRADEDKDGVFDDGDDLCLNTPMGALVDLSGCPVYLFPVDNFEVEINSESCSNQNNGSIRVVAGINMDYEVTLTGNGINKSSNFTNFYFEQGLAAGTYEICIVGTEDDKVYEPYCFQVIVTQPPPLSVTSKLIADGNQTILNLEGGNLYNVELNGIVTQTKSSSIILDLKKGINQIKVTTDLPCQGKFEEQLLLIDEPLVFPNPFEEEVTLLFNNGPDRINTKIFSYNGQLISNKDYTLYSNEIKIDFLGLPSGIYILKVKGEGINSTFKVVKK